MTGMKEGAGDDPFADDVDESSSTTGETTEATMSETTTETTETSTDGSTSDLPYVLTRDGVSQDRKLVRFELRPEFRDLDDEVRREVADQLGTAASDQYIADVREAMVAVAAEHPDEVAELMREWGCEHL
jgi:flagellar biosynthesis/type III secretory pathway M-ring protein FliF/YscJ